MTVATDASYTTRWDSTIRRAGRKVRYRGIARNRIGLAHRCAAINLRRLVNLGLDWDNGWALAT